MLDRVVNFVVYDLAGLSPLGDWGKATHFFVYEIIFVSALLLTVIFIISMVQSYLGAERIRQLLANRPSPVAAVGGAMIGAVTPFCSCSAVPVFIGLIEANAPTAGAFAFLIASPLINELTLALIAGLFGWKVAVLFVSFGAGIAVLVGILVGRLNTSGHVLVNNTSCERDPMESAIVEPPSLAQRLRTAWQSGLSTLRRMSPYLVVALALGSLIRGFVPESAVAGLADAAGPAAVPAAVALGVPLYSGTAVAVPIGYALAEKGVSIGTVVAFMMSVTTLSLPEFVMLRIVLPVRSLVVFAGIVALSIIGVGYLFNMILG